MEHLLSAPWELVGSVVVATVAMYGLLMLLLRVFGQRNLANLSVFDIGIVVALGAVMGRTMLLATPTLLSGAVVLVTLFLLSAALRLVNRGRGVSRAVNRSPILLMDGERMLTDTMRRAGVTADDLRQTLRLAGIADLAQVRCAVLERNGAISVLRADVELDERVVADVPGLAAATASSG